MTAPLRSVRSRVPASALDRGIATGDAGILLFADFHRSTGVAVYGREAGATVQCRCCCGEANVFCEQLVALDVEQQVCAKEHFAARRQVLRGLPPTVRRCQAGLGYVVVPLEVKGRVVGLFECGRTLMRAPRVEVLRQLAGEHPSWQGRGNMAQLEASYMALPIVHRDALAGASRVLASLACALAPGVLERSSCAANEALDGFERAIAYIHAHLAESLRLNEVARQADLAPDYFCRLFRKRTGTTLTRYIAQARFERATQLLRESSLSISEVAEASGFQSTWQFNHLFRRLAQSSPSSYRAQHQTGGRGTSAALWSGQR